MASNRLARRRIQAVVGGAAVIAMIGFTAACTSESDKPEESPTTTTTTTEPTVSPTEKSLNPTGGVFTPPVTAPQQTVEGPND